MNAFVSAMLSALESGDSAWFGHACHAVQSLPPEQAKTLEAEARRWRAVLAARTLDPSALPDFDTAAELAATRLKLS